jgi:hypothetical protein
MLIGTGVDSVVLSMMLHSFGRERMNGAEATTFWEMFFTENSK